MTGVVLAGGEGKRMGLPYNKHLANVYDKPMIQYPLETLKEMGCDSAVIVSTPEGIGDMAKMLRDGAEVGLDITYKVQPHPVGTPHALGYAEGIVKGVFPVLCGDVYLDPAPEPQDEATLYWHEFPEAINHSVWNPETNEIVEKPLRDIGTRAIIAYIFDEKVFDFIRTLEPSDRGELEMVDLYRGYLLEGIKMQEYKGFFADMGTPEGLLKVANYEAGII
jgi:glucose-1-phosphate thymidylyltransferase